MVSIAVLTSRLDRTGSVQQPALCPNPMPSTSARVRRLRDLPANAGRSVLVVRERLRIERIPLDRAMPAVETAVA
jgi:hypothetical protein